MNLRKKERAPLIAIIACEENRDLRILSGVLTAENYKVTSFKDISRNIWPPGQRLPDLIMIGEADLYHKLKEDDKARDIPIIFMGTPEEIKNTIDLFPSHGTDFIIKPLRPLEILLRVERAMSIGKKIKELNEALRGKNNKMPEDMDDRLARIRAHKKDALGDLVAGVVDDFNSFLGIILGNTELALMETGEWNPIRDNLMEVRKASLRAKDMLSQLMGFSSVTTLEHKPVFLARIIRDSIKLLSHSIPPSIRIRRLITETSGPIKADTTQIHQLMINLCGNAVRSMNGREGLLEISVDNQRLDNDQSKGLGLSPGDYVRIGVRDTGAGIHPDILDRIFDPYFTTEYLGVNSGMGLSMVQGIVNNHGGAISVSSKPGKGSLFRVYFPAIDSVALNDRESYLSALGTERILFLDQDERLLRMGSERLILLGYRVDVRRDPVQAMGVIKASPNRFDLVIVGLTNGISTEKAFINEIQTIRPDLPVIVCGKENEKAGGERAGELGADAYLRKPISFYNFTRAVRKVLDDKPK